MKKYQIIVQSFLILIISCENSTSEITGSENVDVIEHVNFSNIEKSLTENSLIVAGVLTNSSSSITISPPWFIECQFYYQNSGNTFLIGGENMTINNSLSPGVSVEWSMSYNVDNPGQYENFTINDLRAYKN
ncbi:MAG: hypothetical protein ACJZ2B_02495 [Candidatus Neomarinimicrobiota bacterium]|tara:strand:- start:216 stop:611 length:396 start_codon:yes stop_codon:yes gene_type:complete